MPMSYTTVSSDRIRAKDNKGSLKIENSNGIYSNRERLP